MNTNKILQQLFQFREERDWQQFHTLENLAKSLVLEASEVLEVFQWKMDHTPLSDPDRAHLADELADVFNLVLLLAHDADIDLEKAALAKIVKNHQKYPIEKAKGRARKYSSLD
jgi:NTP pyrophosphatase (non-canonical NTP hydrolase)